MSLGEYHDDPTQKRTPRTSGISGTGYDRWSYEQATKRGAGGNDTPLNKLQYKFWVAKSKVVRKLGKDEDECVVASDAELDAKLELYHSISETTKDLQRILDQYNDRLCNLAYEENSYGRFLKDFGKLEKTRAGKIMMASGKAMSYSSQQRLALRPSIIRLAEEVDTFRFRAIEDTNDTVSAMEKVRTEYRGALMWMKNVSTELDPDTYKQLEKFRKVQVHVKTSKSKFDRLKIDCIQKIDLLAAARCNMYSHALVMYQDALIHFSEKVAKTFSHVESSFKGYQPYEFQYIRELAEPNRMFTELERKSKSKKKASKEKTEEKVEEPKEEVKDEKYFFDLDDNPDQSPEVGQDALELAKESEASINNLLELEDKDDELLLHWEEQRNKTKDNQESQEGAGLLPSSDTHLLDDLAGLDVSSPTKETSPNDSPARFSAQWNKLFGQEPKMIDDNTVPDLNLETLGQTDDDFGSFFSASKEPSDKDKDTKPVLPSQLFDLDQSLFSLQSPRQENHESSEPSKNGNTDANDLKSNPMLPSLLFDLDQSLFSQQNPKGPHDLLSDFPMPSPARPSAVQKQLDLLQQKEEELRNSDLLSDLELPNDSSNAATTQAKPSTSSKDMSQWFSLFADLDPLANPDAIGKSTKESDPNCYS